MEETNAETLYMSQEQQDAIESLITIPQQGIGAPQVVSDILPRQIDVHCYQYNRILMMVQPRVKYFKKLQPSLNALLN